MSDLNKIKKPDIILDLDRERKLKYTLNSFAEMEERYGSVDKALQLVQDNNMRAIIFMLWAGLMWEDDELTEKKVGNLIEISELQDIAEKMGKAVGGDMPVPVKKPAIITKVGEGPNA